MKSPIAATALPHGLAHVFGVDHFGTAFSFAIDPLVLTRACDQMSATADLMLAGRRHRDEREAFDMSLENDPIEHTS